MIPLIAIADDDPDVLDMVELLLAVHGYRTVSTTTAAAVPALIQQHRPALLLLDIRMEQRDSGWRVLDGLRVDLATAQLPVIVCSAEHDVAAHVQQRDDPYLMGVSKPFQPPHLLTKIRQALDTAQARDAASA